MAYGKYYSVGLFHECLDKLNVGPWFKISLIENNAKLLIECHNHSVNASAPHDQPPNV